MGASQQPGPSVAEWRPLASKWFVGAKVGIEERYMARNGYRVFDSDMHVYDAHSLYENYMNPRWGERIPRGTKRTKHGRIEFSLGSGEVLRKRSKLLEHGEDKVAERYEYALEQTYDAPSQVVAMDKEGIDVAVMFRTSPLHCDDSFDPDYAIDLCRAWNDWITEFCGECPDRMKASGLLTLHDVDLAVDEARRAVTELGAVGLSVCPEPVNGRRIHDRYYDPLWAEIDRVSVPLCFHPPANPKQRQVSLDFYDHPNSSVIVNALRNPIELQLAVSAFCGGGVLEKFPTLKVAFLEGNCAWLPWLLYRLDERAELHGSLADVPLSRKPSDYFLDQCYVSVDVDEYLVTDVIGRLGDENIVISTDYPHADAHYPNAVEEFMDTPGLGNGSMEKILWGNCARLYGVG